MTAAILVLAGLAPEVLFTNYPTNRDDVILEVVKVIGIAISAAASCFALWVAQKNSRTGQRIERNTARRRRQVRREDHPNGEHNVVIEEKADADADA